MKEDLLAVVVLALDEEKNLPFLLRSVRPLRCPVIVVDSGSRDDTCEIARQAGARILTHQFESHARQWRWALENLPCRPRWILGLDADQWLTSELADEIGNVLGGADSREMDGYFINRRQIFQGRWIRHGGYYPKYLLKLFRADRVWLDETDLVDHHFRVPGSTGQLCHDLIEENRNERDISVWVDKHNRYARRQASEEFARRGSSEAGRVLGDPDQRVLWRKSLWRRFPLFWRPFIYFCHRYFVRLGFLDGKQGLVFHFLQGFWYRFLVDVHLDQLRRRSGSVS